MAFWRQLRFQLLTVSLFQHLLSPKCHPILTPLLAIRRLFQRVFPLKRVPSPTNISQPLPTICRQNATQFWPPPWGFGDEALSKRGIAKTTPYLISAKIFPWNNIFPPGKIPPTSCFFSSLAKIAPKVGRDFTRWNFPYLLQLIKLAPVFFFFTWFPVLRTY